MQLSVAVGADEIVAKHCPVTAGKEVTFATGAIVSVTTISWVCMLEFPTASLKVQVTVDVPCIVLVNASEVVPVIIPLQLSVAVGAEAMVAEHCPVTAAKLATLVTGAILSFTTIF